MVLEQLIATNWVEKKPWHAFLLGFAYAILGIIGAYFIFGANPSYMAVALTAIFILPSLNKLLAMEENVEIREKKFHLKQLFKDHRDIFEIYFFMFMGIMIAYSIVVFVLPNSIVMKLFQSQLATGGFKGHAFSSGLFWSLFMNNLKIMIVVLILSIVYGAGSILFISWNAAVWGVVAGFVAKTISYQNMLLYYFHDFFIRLPHTLLEMSAYIFVAIAGGVVSKAVLREKLYSKKFNHVLTDGLIFFGISLVCVFLGALIESIVLANFL